MHTSRRLVSQLPLLLVLVAGIAAWLPLVMAGRTPAIAATTPVPDQQVMLQIGNDLGASAGGSVFEQSAPFFMPLCDNEQGRWAQTMRAGLTARLVQVDLLLLRRSADVAAPVEIEIRAVDSTGRPTETVLAHGATAATIPVDRARPGWLTIPLDAPLRLLAGQPVAIFPSSTASASGACYEWPSAGRDQYTGGSLALTHDLGETFVLEGGQDAGFRTWVR
jgi:hypothetical protein